MESRLGLEDIGPLVDQRRGQGDRHLAGQGEAVERKAVGPSSAGEMPSRIASIARALGQLLFEQRQAGAIVGSWPCALSTSTSVPTPARCALGGEVDVAFVLGEQLALGGDAIVERGDRQHLLRPRGRR